MRIITPQSLHNRHLSSSPQFRYHARLEEWDSARYSLNHEGLNDSLTWLDLVDNSPTERTIEEQECLKHIWLILQNLRFDFSNQLSPKSTKIKKQL